MRRWEEFTEEAGVSWVQRQVEFHLCVGREGPLLDIEGRGPGRSSIGGGHDGRGGPRAGTWTLSWWDKESAEVCKQIVP